VPYEQLKKSFRHQYKYIEKEIQHVEEKIEVCLKSANKGELTAETATKAIDDLMKELEKFTQKVTNT
jgi:macrophage erythroblast attacher